MATIAPELPENLSNLSFDDIYRKYYRQVFSICLRMLANRADAEDLTQETFITIYRKLSSFRGDSKFTTWLYRVTVNQVLMYLRKHQTKFEQTTRDDEGITDLVEQRQTRTNPELEIITKIHIERTINQLPPGYRQTLTLHDIFGLEHQEIAAQLNINEGTSKSQSHKGRTRFRKLYQQ